MTGVLTTDVFYDFILRTTSDGIIIADNDHRVLTVNPAAAAMLRLTVEELIGKHPEQCFSKFPALMNLFMRDGEQRLDVRLPKTPSGSWDRHHLQGWRSDGAASGCD